MAALLMRLNDFVHMRIKARRNTLHEQPLAKLVEFGERLTTQITAARTIRCSNSKRPNR